MSWTPISTNATAYTNIGPNPAGWFVGWFIIGWFTDGWTGDTTATTSWTEI